MSVYSRAKAALTRLAVHAGRDKAPYSRFPAIPAGKIIARPNADGGYSLSVYIGGRIGWISGGEVGPGEDVHQAMKYLARPIIGLVPTKDADTK